MAPWAGQNKYDDESIISLICPSEINVQWFNYVTSSLKSAPRDSSTQRPRGLRGPSDASSGLSRPNFTVTIACSTQNKCRATMAAVRAL